MNMAGPRSANRKATSSAASERLIGGGFIPSPSFESMPRRPSKTFLTGAPAVPAPNRNVKIPRHGAPVVLCHNSRRPLWPASFCRRGARACPLPSPGSSHDGYRHRRALRRPRCWSPAKAGCPGRPRGWAAGPQRGSRFEGFGELEGQTFGGTARLEEFRQRDLGHVEPLLLQSRDQAATGAV